MVSRIISTGSGKAVVVLGQEPWSSTGDDVVCRQVSECGAMMVGGGTEVETIVDSVGDV